ncbi:MAG: hypothetical protein QW086_00695 [Pyrobaculum sp.]
MSGLRAGVAGSLVAAVVILILLPLIATLGVSHSLNLSLMTLLVALAVYVYLSFSRPLGEPWFVRLGPPVIGASAAGVALLWAGQQVGAVLIAVAYWGEPVMGYFIYKRLREVSRLWAALFLGSAAAYAYTLPVVLLGLWQVPAAADAAKLAALVYFLGKLR